MNFNGFLDLGELVDEDLRLVLSYARRAQHAIGLHYPRYRFSMRHSDSNVELGEFEFRLGDDAFIKKYAGHLFYEVAPQHRGHRYAARSCKLIYPLARMHKYKEIWITCNPDNEPSRRTCEILGGELVGIGRVPPGSYYEQIGEFNKCQYRIKL